MRIALIRCGLTAGTALFLALAFVAPGGAQSTQEVTISYSAQADTAALELDLGGGALTLSAATTGSEVTSDGPSASGFGQVIEGDDSTRSATEAPPDESADATAAAQSLADPADLFALDVAAGESSSESEAEDGTPSTDNAATLGDILITQGTGATVFDFSVSITALDSDSRAKANNSPMASASASATGAVIDVQVDASQLTAEVCTALGNVPGVGDQLETQCNTLAQQVELQDFLSATVADGEVDCSWADSKPAATGSAQLVDLSVLGQPVPIEIGEEVTIAGGTPLETTVGAGAFSKTVQNGGLEEEDTATARASGAFLELFAQEIVFNLGDATCGVAGLVESAEVIARTGGEILPVLFGGAALAGAGYGLRRFLKR